MSRKRAYTLYLDDEWIEWMKDVVYTQKTFLGQHASLGSIVEKALTVYAEQLPFKVEQRSAEVRRAEEERTALSVAGKKRALEQRAGANVPMSTVETIPPRKKD